LAISGSVVTIKKEGLAPGSVGFSDLLDEVVLSRLAMGENVKDSEHKKQRAEVLHVVQNG